MKTLVREFRSEISKVPIHNKLERKKIIEKYFTMATKIHSKIK